MYDVVVIGGGPAGGNAAELAQQEGLKTLLIEQRKLGGVCLNEGCIPSKALLHCSRLYAQAKESQVFGVTVQHADFDIKAAMARKDKLVQRIRRASENNKKRKNVDVVYERAHIISPSGDMFRVKAGEKNYAAKKLLLCTGSDAVRLPVPGADQPFVYTNREILSIDFIPEKLVIIGGGVIGLEFATIFAEIGSRVTIIEMLPGIAGEVDQEISTILGKQLEKRGVNIVLNSRVTEIGDKHVMFEDFDGGRHTVAADIVLMSVGRRPSTEGLGLEKIGVEMKGSRVKVDLQGRTNVSGVYAAGDINGRSMLAHTASREAEVVIDTIMGREAVVNYDAIPNVIYSHPEIASVGLTKEQALERGYDVATSKIPLGYSGRYLAETERGYGIIKAVADKDSGTLLGIHMIGGECSEMIYGASVMIQKKMKINEISDVVFPHPTVAEVIKDAILEIDI
ncbi:MAG: dihydrolipoyl dehydrogenase [Chitinivibrionales bacterium]